MPNEAYLYSTEQPGAWAHPEEGYFTSRWVIPLGWFFFFRASDITLADETFDGSISWKEGRLSAEKNTALRLFADRRSLLLALIAGRIPEERVDHFFEAIRGCPGRYLIMDPSSVYGDDENDTPFFANVFALIETGSMTTLTELDREGAVVGGFRGGRERYIEDVLGSGPVRLFPPDVECLA